MLRTTPGREMLRTRQHESCDETEAMGSLSRKLYQVRVTLGECLLLSLLRWLSLSDGPGIDSRRGQAIRGDAFERATPQVRVCVMHACA